ncbi:MAG: hypothetical protein AMS16_04345 [Planctomycetes bacterium DG_58]|nr:MAG: hypothetical protein AMS16_04345 [Planctomycetes bacterium DG_58]
MFAVASGLPAGTVNKEKGRIAMKWFGRLGGNGRDAKAAVVTPGIADTSGEGVERNPILVLQG